jgi:hypothetical protein
MRKFIITSVATLALTLGALSSAQADDGPPTALQAEVESILAEHPGGLQTAANTISWEGGTVILTLATGGITSLSVGNCATNYYCAYTGTTLSGSKLSFSACDTTVGLSALPGVVRSIANARSSGYVQGQTSGGSTLTTVYAGGQVNSAPTGISQLRCVS